jgi:hypothetical protein
VNLEGLTEKRNKAGTIYYEEQSGEIVAKCCSECGKASTLEDFYKKKRGLGGRNSICKCCKAKSDSNWYEQNRETVIENQYEYRKQNREKIAEYDRIRYEKNREKIAHQRKTRQEAIQAN